jgi:hypothetical protein
MVGVPGPSAKLSYPGSVKKYLYFLHPCDRVQAPDSFADGGRARLLRDRVILNNFKFAD